MKQFYETDDYEYRYKKFHTGYSWKDIDEDGWGIKVKNKDKETYEPILEEIDGSPVIALHNIFSYCKNLKKIPKIPDCVKYMHGAFWGCENIEYFYKFPKKIQDITFAFCNCRKLKVCPNIPNNIQDLTNLFSGCESLVKYYGSDAEDGDFSNFIIPQYANKLYGLFRKCKKIKFPPKIPTTATDICCMFKDCENLLKAPSLPLYLEELRSTFDGCYKLEIAPVLPVGVKSLENAFSDCVSLSSYENSKEGKGNFSKYNIPQSVFSLKNCFMDCHEMVIPPKIPNTVRDMYYTFANCSNLKILPNLPESAVSIPFVFANCIKADTYIDSKDSKGDFSHYNIPKTVKNMSGAFKYCKNIEYAPTIPFENVNCSEIFDGNTIY